jgi:hypothetical protein
MAVLRLVHFTFAIEPIDFENSCYLLLMFSPRRLGSPSGSVHMNVWSRMVPGQAFLRVLLFSPHSNIPPVLHTHISCEG